MVRPDIVLKSVTTALKESGRLPDATSYSVYELDEDGGQADVRPPVVEVTVIDTVRATPHNTDFVGYVEDDAGNHVGRVYRALFEMSIQIDVWTAEGDQYDPYEIGQSVRQVLYRHDEHMVGDALPDPSDPSQSVGGIDYFSVNDGSVRNDLSMTPALRRWRQTAEVWFSEVVSTDEPYIETVRSPGDGDFAAGTDSVELVYDATPSTESTADNYS